MYSIGDLAKVSGVKLETIRYYERIGLMPLPPRNGGGHRVYDDDHRQRLSFIRRARELGFNIDDVRSLLSLSHRRGEPCRPVYEIAVHHLAEVRRKIEDLTRLEAALKAASDQCDGQIIGIDCAVLAMLNA